MQTFLPFADLAKTAACLDRQRLGKQRVETLQIMSAIVKGTGWGNHPATRMWASTPRALLEYQRVICHEWVEVRGYADTCLKKTAFIFFDGTDASSPDRELQWPWWLGDDALHRSHRSNLLRKNPVHYEPFFELGLPSTLEYVWPV